MRKFLTSGRRRYALLLLALGAGSLAIMGNSCAPTKQPAPPPALSISPLAKVFADTKVGQTSSDQTFTVTNNGSGKTGTIKTQLLGGNDNQFLLSPDNCNGVKLDSGQTCTIDVAFKPTATGLLATTLVVNSDQASDGTASAHLEGTGTP
jgi:hypothetical protein